jgi:hypothetical protein
MSAVRKSSRKTEANIGQAEYNTHWLHPPTPVVPGPPILAIVFAHLLVSCRLDPNGPQPELTRLQARRGNK